MNERALSAAVALAATLALVLPLRAQAGAPAGRLRSEDALRLASEHNPSMRSSLLDKEQAAVAVRAEEGLYPLMLQLDGGFTHSSSPSLAAGGGVSHRSSNTTAVGAELSKTTPIGTQASLRVDGSHQATDSGGEGPGYGIGARLAVTQPVLRGAGKEVVEASLRQAIRAEELAAHRTRRVASELALQVLETYWELWYAERAVEIERRARDLAREQLEDMEARVAAGDRASVDALPFETRLATLEESVVAAETTRNGLSVRLAGLIGFGSSRDHVAADTDESPVDVGEMRDLDAAVATALANSPDVREQLAAISLADERARTAGEQMRPRLDIVGWLEANTLGNGEVSPAFSQFGDGQAYSAYVGLVYELPLSDTRKEAQRASAALDVEIATQQLLATKDAVKADVLTAQEKVSSIATRLALARRTHDVAMRQAEAERARYDLGAAIFVQVREAEEAVREAELRATRAEVDLALARLELEHLTGTLLERYPGLVAPVRDPATD